MEKTVNSVENIIETNNVPNTEINTEIKNNRHYKAYIEILRLVACFLVIANHTVLYTIIPNAPGKLWYGSWVYFFVSKISVPVFLMISGALLLGKEDSYKKCFMRALRVLLALIAFSAIYYINSAVLSSRVASVDEEAAKYTVGNFFLLILREPITNAYWYMYLYMALLVMLPFLQKMVKNMKASDFRVFLFVSFVILGALPILNHYFGSVRLAEDFNLILFSTYIGYLLAGYYIDRYMVITTKKAAISAALFVVSIIFSVVFTKLEYNQNPGSYFFYDNIKMLPIIVSGVSVFVCAKYFLDVKCSFREKTARILRELGACTFAAYLLADFFLEKFAFVIDAFWDKSQLLSVVLLQLLTYIAVMAIAFLLRRIPFLKKII